MKFIQSFNNFLIEEKTLKQRREEILKKISTIEDNIDKSNIVVDIEKEIEISVDLDTSVEVGQLQLQLENLKTELIWLEKKIGILN